jgi:hypothetical protein
MSVSQAKKKGETVKRKVLKLSEDKNGSAYIKELREIQVGGWVGFDIFSRKLVGFGAFD